MLKQSKKRSNPPAPDASVTFNNPETWYAFCKISNY